jgi:lysophospholipase L1-like esterase
MLAFSSHVVAVFGVVLLTAWSGIRGADRVEPAPSPRALQPNPANPPLTLTAQQDRQLMLDQLKIPAEAMRRGPNGLNPKAPDYQNTDEAKANPWPNLPEMMVTKGRKKVDTPELWWNVRRPEIVEYFDAEVYGRVPKDVPKVTWEVDKDGKGGFGGFGGKAPAPTVPTVTKRLVGRVDNSACPDITVNVRLTLILPANAAGPVPVMMDFGGGGGMQQYLTEGWGYALVSPASIQADNGAGLTRGIIGLCNKGQPRKPDDWGALRAWAWGAGRALDYLETDKDVDARQVGISGLSRYGKAALVAMAYDQRFAVGLIGSSGAGGAKLLRRNWGEQVENLASSGEYHWMAGNFLKYAGPLAPCDLPVDAHELIALCAPRPTFISYGAMTGPGAEGYWVDQKGSFMAAVAAGPAWKILGKKDLGTTEMPAVGTALVDGELAWRMHSGGHTTGPNIDTFVSWASRYLKGPAAKGPAAKEPPGKEPAARPRALAVTPITRTDANSKTAHEQLLEKAKKGRIDVYFTGDSITRRWGATDYPAFLANWKENFHGWNAANFGWGGDAVQNVLWRLRNGELDGVNPKVIVVMAGTNNVGTRGPAGGEAAKAAEIADGLKAVLDTCREKAPGAVVILMGITPRNDNPGAPAIIDKVNERLARLADGKKVRYLNINDKLADKDGRLLEGMSPDRLHLSVKGYQVWADALKPVLTELLGPPAEEDLAPPPTGDPSAAGKTAAPPKK